MSDTSAQAAVKQSPVSAIEQDQSLSLLFDVSRELTSILARDELLRRIAERVKKIVNYHLFNVMVWNEASSQLECIFTKHYEEAINIDLTLPLFKGITGHAAGNRCAVRVGASAWTSGMWNSPTATESVRNWSFLSCFRIA
jgi:nitrate/nitrite-specific signal transduction histidine kinase